MVKRLSFIFLFLLPFLIYPTLVHGGGKADAIAGYLAGERGEDALAVKLCTRAIMSGELSAENLVHSYNNRGRSYMGLGQYDRAIADFNKATELDPTYIFAYNNRGNTYIVLGQFERAMPDLDRAIELNPDYASPYFHRGTVYIYRGEFNRALADYNKAFELEPGDEVDYNNRGIAYRGLGNYDKALADFNKSLELNPNYVSAHRSLGTTYFFLGQFDEAKASFEPVLGMNSGSHVYYALIWYYLSHKRAGRAEAVRLAGYTNRLDLTKWPGPVLKLFLGTTTPDGLFAEAKDRDKTAENQKLCEVYFYLGQYYLIMGEASKARNMFEHCLDTGVKAFIEYRGAKIELAKEKGKEEKKISDPKVELAYTKRGTAYLKKGQYAKAIEEYNKALKVNPDCALAYYNRSVAYTSTRQYDKAVSDCTKALQLNPRHANSYYSRGVSYWYLGSKNQAIQDLQAAAKLQHQEAQDFLKTMNVRW